MLRTIAPTAFAPVSLAIALCLAAPAKTPVQPVQVVTTDKVDFSGSTIRFEGSVGQLNIEGWDEPRVQVTVTRIDYADAKDKDALQKKLQTIAVKTGRNGNELVITTTLPHRNFFVRKVRGLTDANMNYRVMVPRGANLIVHHGNGDVVIYDVGGDIDATAGVGTIVAQVAEPEKYAVNAHTMVGEVYTDYDGKYRSPWLMGDTFAPSPDKAAHHVNAKVRIGSIDVIKMGPNPITAPTPAK